MRELIGRLWYVSKVGCGSSRIYPKKNIQQRPQLCNFSKSCKVRFSCENITSFIEWWKFIYLRSFMRCLQNTRTLTLISAEIVFSSKPGCDHDLLWPCQIFLYGSYFLLKNVSALENACFFNLAGFKETIPWTLLEMLFRSFEQGS